jgi:hypothetical protein
MKAVVTPSWGLAGPSADSYIVSVNCLEGFSFTPVNVYAASRMSSFKNRLRIVAIVALAASACSGSNDNAHTTAITFVSPPPRQVLRAESRPAKQLPAKPDDPGMKVDTNKSLLIFNLPNGKTFREDEEVVIDFSLANAKLKADGGEYRVRYIVDDDEMKYLDRWEQIALTGWTPGKHTIRLELIGPDGWPYRNGDYNIVTRELTIVK